MGGADFCSPIPSVSLALGEIAGSLGFSGSAGLAGTDCVASDGAGERDVFTFEKILFQMNGPRVNTNRTALVAIAAWVTLFIKVLEAMTPSISLGLLPRMVMRNARISSRVAVVLARSLRMSPVGLICGEGGAGSWLDFIVLGSFMFRIFVFLENVHHFSPGKTDGLDGRFEMLSLDAPVHFQVDAALACGALAKDLLQLFTQLR